MSRKGLFSVVVLVLFLSIAVPAFCQQQDAAPPTAFRWDNPPSSTSEITPGPVPTVYKLNVALAQCDELDVDEFGRLYVLDGARKEMLRFSNAGVLEQTWVDGPHDSVWTMARSSIQALPDGRIFLGPGWGLHAIRIVGPGANDDRVLPCDRDAGRIITALEDGSYYLDIYGRRLEDGSFKSARVAHIGANGEELSSWDREQIDDLVVGPDGLFYGLLRSAAAINVYSKTGKLVRQINVESIVKRVPTSGKVIGVDRNGDIYFQLDAIYRLDSQGHPLARWYAYRSKEDVNTFVSFFHAAVVRNGLIYAVATGGTPVDPMARVALTVHRQIQVFTMSGQCVARYMTTQEPPSFPLSIAVLSNGTHAVMERGRQKAFAVDAVGVRRPFEYDKEAQMLLGRDDEFLLASNGVLTSFDSQGKKRKVLHNSSSNINAELDVKSGRANMWQVAFDPLNGDIWALGWGGMITHMSATDAIVKEFPKNMRLCLPTFCVGLAMDRKGFLYMPYPQKHRVEKVDREGNVVLSIGGEGSEVGQLMFPEGLAFDSQDRLYVADSGNSRIQVFDTDGKSLGAYGKRGQGDGEFDRPYGITIAPNGDLWVADTHNDRVVRIPMKKFWAGVKIKLTPEPVVAPPAHEPEPIAGQVSVTGVIVAGSEDYGDVVYLEDVNRAWGVEVVMPAGKAVKRGTKCKVTGKLADKGAAKRLVASVDAVEVPYAAGEAVPAAVGMANLYIGDGYRGGDKKMDISNLAMLVKSWGKVTAFDVRAKMFVIDDGSFPGRGLTVHMDGKRVPSTLWPEVGQYVSVTGVSVKRVDAQGKSSCGVRVRDVNDIAVLSQ